MINAIANDYRFAQFKDPSKPGRILFLGKDDGGVNINVRNFGDALEATRKSLAGQNVLNDVYWQQVTNAISHEIENSDVDSIPGWKDGTRAFFTQHIEFLKQLSQQTGNNNNALVLLTAAMFEVKHLNFEWRKKLVGVNTTAARGAADGSQSDAAAQGVPQWYQRMTGHHRAHWERHQEHRENHWARKRAWHRTIHAY